MNNRVRDASLSMNRIFVLLRESVFSFVRYKVRQDFKGLCSCTYAYICICDTHRLIEVFSSFVFLHAQCRTAEGYKMLRSRIDAYNWLGDALWSDNRTNLYSPPKIPGFFHTI